jgi:hypothetical protein
VQPVGLAHELAERLVQVDRQAAGSLAVGGLVARRTSAAIWGAVMREPPPSSKA